MDDQILAQPDRPELVLPRKVIGDPVELAAAYGLAWPADACRHCGGQLVDGQCAGAEACADPTCSRACHVDGGERS